MKVTFVGHCKHGTKTLEIYVLRANLMMFGHAQVTRRAQRFFRMFLRDLEHGGLRPISRSIHQVHYRALVLADYSRVRCDDKIFDGSRVPMIAAGHSTPMVQALLHDSPLSIRCHDETMQVNLKPVS